MNEPISPELWAAYHDTRFEAETPLGRVSIRVNDSSHLVDALCRQTDTATWCFITAWHPRSEPTSDAQNHAANEALHAELERCGYTVYTGAGRPDSTDWEPEESFLALGVPRDQAIRLGRRFKQNAVVWGELGGVARMLDTRGSLS